ncbi:hypothetical protein BKA64DRAFT_769404 [Cadophora sp. MPI-SDFR-AT-0126]|nr:hypothetical protein BKA64DRAFT_769404 [Leotiomycetes sp. MPI-SDFR-AT-0126]
MSSSASNYLGESLGTEIVTIYVGTEPNRKQFTIHKKLICDKVDFFRKEFMGGFKENEGTMDLSEEKPAVFGMFVDWLYSSNSQVRKCTTNEQFVGLFNLYFFAERLCINNLQNRLIDRIRLTAAGILEHERHGPWITIPFAAFIFNNTAKGSTIRKYCIHELAYRLWMQKEKTFDSTLPDSEAMSEISAHWSQQPDLMKEFFDFLRSAPNEIDPPGIDYEWHQQEVLECRFHNHGKDEICYVDVEDTEFVGDTWDEKMVFGD